jgi:hypothetical protein
VELITPHRTIYHETRKGRPRPGLGCSATNHHHRRWICLCLLKSYKRHGCKAPRNLDRTECLASSFGLSTFEERPPPTLRYQSDWRLREEHLAVTRNQSSTMQLVACYFTDLTGTAHSWVSVLVGAGFSRHHGISLRHTPPWHGTQVQGKICIYPLPTGYIRSALMIHK